MEKVWLIKQSFCAIAKPKLWQRKKKKRDLKKLSRRKVLTYYVQCGRVDDKVVVLGFREGADEEKLSRSAVQNRGQYRCRGSRRRGRRIRQWTDSIVDDDDDGDDDDRWQFVGKMCKKKRQGKKIKENWLTNRKKLNTVVKKLFAAER